MIRPSFALLLIGITSQFIACSARQTNAPQTTADMSPATIESAMQAASSVNDNHKLLASLAGKWNTEMRCWISGTEEPELSEGSVNSQLIFGGRFLKENFIGNSPQGPFNGLGLIGYDNLRGKFTSVWIDSMNTSSSLWYGTYNPQTKTITFEGSQINPITKQEQGIKATLTLASDKIHIFEMSQESSPGEYTRMMEVTYRKG